MEFIFKAKKLFKQLKKTLKKIDVNLIDVARARIHATNIEEWKPIGRAHSESFRDIQSATTMVMIERPFQPEMRSEMEADAIAKWPNFTALQCPTPRNPTLRLFIPSLA